MTPPLADLTQVRVDHWDLLLLTLPGSFWVCCLPVYPSNVMFLESSLFFFFPYLNFQIILKIL